MYCRGIRGATTVEQNEAAAIVAAARELLEAIILANTISPDDIASVVFSVTPDLNAVFPARAARELGWTNTALFCCQEIDVPGGLPMCIRVLVHWNTPQKQSEIVHVYLKEAKTLRPDL